MNGRKRTVQIKFRVTEEERAFIEQKMQLVPTRNMEAYLRKMAIDGYIIQIDHVDNLLTSFYQLDDEARKEVVETIQFKLQYHRDPERAEQIKQIKGW